MNNADPTWLFRHVPSIKDACIQLMGSLLCDNRTVYITNALEHKKCRETKTDELISAIFRLKTLFQLMLITPARISPFED